MTGKACHVLASATQVGLIQALDLHFRVKAPRTVRFVGFIAAAVLLCCSLAKAEEGASTSTDWKTLHFAGYNLAYTCAGTARPVLILEAPAGIAAEKAYEKIFHELAKRHRVCFVERLGLGKSDDAPPNLVQTTKDYASGVLRLVDVVAPDEKVVLIGYSFGGFVVRYFAATHPERTAGLLLIDAQHEDWLVDLKRRMSPDDWSKMQGILDWFKSRLGHNNWDSQFEVKGVSLPRDMPIRMISRGLPYQSIRKANLSEEGVRLYNESHDRLQFELLKLTDNSSRVVATKSEHLIVESEPELVLSEIAKLASQVSKGN